MESMLLVLWQWIPASKDSLMTLRSSWLQTLGYNMIDSILKISSSCPILDQKRNIYLIDLFLDLCRSICLVDIPFFHQNKYQKMTVSQTPGNWSSRRPVRSQPLLESCKWPPSVQSPTHGGTCTNLRSDLVGGWPTPPKNMKVSWDESQLGFPIYGKIKNDPNQQPDTVLNIFNHFHTYSLKFGWISSFWPNVSIKTYQQKNCNKSLTFSNHPALLLASFFVSGRHVVRQGEPMLQCPEVQHWRHHAHGGFGKPPPAPNGWKNLER